MAEIALESRTGVGSAEARRLRHAGRVPGVLYGHGTPTLVSVDAAALGHTVTPAQYGAAIVPISLDGRPAGDALVKAVQVHTLSRRILSLELQRVTADDRVQVSVPVALDGALPTGAVLEQMQHNVPLRCQASAVPEALTFDITVLGVGDVLHAAQLALPSACELLVNPDEVIAVIAGPTIPALEEPVRVEPVSGPMLTGEKQMESGLEAA
jgi:large subunit ribosomal protein L25